MLGYLLIVFLLLVMTLCLIKNWKEVDRESASTIHKVCGDALRKGVTQIRSDPKLKYYLWEK
eukprot:8237301-Ditylum_brightwellii.AAC.1